MPLPLFYLQSPDILSRTKKMNPLETAINTTPTVEELMALERMRRKRLCPGISKLIAGGSAVARHLEFCENCRERMDFLSRRKKLSSDIPLLAPRATVNPQEGQIRDLKKSSSGMIDSSKDEYLYNPPLVLIIQIPDNGAPFVRVAQMHDEPELAGPGDVAVEMPDGIRFIESWNTYPILIKYLGPVLESVPQEVVRRVLMDEKKDMPDFPEDSPLEAFRELETRVAYNFCHYSVREMMLMQEEREGKKCRAKVHKFSPPRYNGIRDEWNRPDIFGDNAAMNAFRDHIDPAKYGGVTATASKFMGFPFPAVACCACVVGGLADFIGRKDDDISETDQIKKFLKDTVGFKESAKKIFHDYESGNILRDNARKEIETLSINAEKAANAALFLAARMMEKANNNEIKIRTASHAKENAERAQSNMSDIQEYLDILKNNGD